MRRCLDRALVHAGAEEMLEALYGKCRLFICSNGNAQVQDGRLASSGIEKYFEGIFISERIGYDKPDARYFDACFGAYTGFLKGAGDNDRRQPDFGHPGGSKRRDKDLLVQPQKRGEPERFEARLRDTPTSTDSGLIEQIFC